MAFCHSREGGNPENGKIQLFYETIKYEQKPQNAQK